MIVSLTDMRAPYEVLCLHAYRVTPFILSLEKSWTSEAKKDTFKPKMLEQTE